MTILQSVFGSPKVFLPVIHPLSEKTALQSIACAVNADADGIFLINQGMSGKEVLSFNNKVRSLYPDLWIGINLLGYYTHETFEALSVGDFNGLWRDNAQVDENETTQSFPEKFATVRSESGWKGIYFGGVAFKGQRPGAVPQTG